MVWICVVKGKSDGTGSDVWLPSNQLLDIDKLLPIGSHGWHRRRREISIWRDRRVVNREFTVNLCMQAQQYINELVVHFDLNQKLLICYDLVQVDLEFSIFGDICKISGYLN